MTKNKLLELYEKLNQERLDIGAIQELKEYTDEEIDSIINSKYIEIILSLIQHKVFKLLSKVQRKQIINIINNTPTSGVARTIYFLSWNKDAIESGKIVESAKIISESVGYDQAYNAYNVAVSQRILMNENCLEILKLISKAKNKTIAEIIYILALDEYLLLNENCLELIKLVSTSDSDNKADIAASVAKNKQLLEANKSVYYVTKIIQAKDEREVRTIYSEARKEIEKLKEQSKSEDSFWNIFNNNPEQAISLLKTNIAESEEITSHTIVRKLRKNPK